ncbi:outer membrane beta-barrel protein [Xanthovirga aplysinae]|uniref:outer membrane beta-barrel protein n=1 Tax=Xanthovirga aplysinae TaxID=2529853 RepID=UPI0012BBC965|nr:outer membrane beta-barrel protein [Xanthovirga aplysinae]MTI32299.1 hypothetical protein [Xanthovirga aplysinae]
MKILFFILFVLHCSLMVMAQTEEVDKSKKRKVKKGNDKKLSVKKIYKEYKAIDGPGLFYLSRGWDILNNKGPQLAINIWGSRYADVYYMYDVRLFKSKFSVRPGIGISSNRFKFAKKVKNNTLIALDRAPSEVVPLQTLQGFENIMRVDKSQFQVVFLDLAFEAVFRTNRIKPKKGFFFTLGVRGGLRIDSKTKVKFRQDNRPKKQKDKQKFNFNNTRFSFGAKTGWDFIGVFYWWTTTPLFVRGLSPIGAENTNYMNFGIVVVLF